MITKRETPNVLEACLARWNCSEAIQGENGWQDRARRLRYSSGGVPVTDAYPAGRCQVISECGSLNWRQQLSKPKSHPDCYREAHFWGSIRAAWNWYYFRIAVARRFLYPEKLAPAAPTAYCEQTRNWLRQDSEGQDRAGFNGHPDLIRAMNRLMQ
jgi:hypothetical protein